VELEELHERMDGVESEHTIVAMQLSRSVMQISDALVDQGVFPIQDIPAHLKSAQDVFAVASRFLDHLRRNMPPALVPGSKTWRIMAPPRWQAIPFAISFFLLLVWL
jgi:hypothetical protein